VDFKQLGLTKKLINLDGILKMSNPERNNQSNPEYQGRKREVRNDSCRPFVQIDVELIHLLSNSEFKMYAQIMKRAGSVDGRCWESIEHMSIETKMSVRNIKRTAKSLLGKNLVKKTKRPGTTDLYTLTPPSEWVFSTDEPSKEIAYFELPGIEDDESEGCQNGTTGGAKMARQGCQNGTTGGAKMARQGCQNGTQIRSPEIYKEELNTTRNPEGARGYSCDSKSFEPENPETATDRGQDIDLEPLRKATTYQNPEPETAMQDCPEPDIDPLRKAQTFRNSEQNLSSPVETTQKSSTSNSNLEETNIPPAAAKISRVEAASTLAKVSEAITPKSSGLTARFSGGADPLGDRFKISGSWQSRKPLLDQAIAAYSQARHSSWGTAPQSPSSILYMSLDKIFRRLVSDEVPNPEEEFLLVIASATLWVSSSDWHTTPGFGNRNLSWLIDSPDRVLKYADKWRSKPQEEMVGTAIKITQDSAEKTYCGIDGKPTKRAWARMDWKDLSRRAKAGEEITQVEKDWANYYFSEYDIYLEHEDI
jgi:hypothetical protein